MKDLRGCDCVCVPRRVKGASGHGDPEAGLMGKELWLSGEGLAEIELQWVEKNLHLMGLLP